MRRAAASSPASAAPAAPWSRSPPSLNTAGTDFVLADGSIAPPRTLHALLGASPAPLTHKDLLTRWPGDKPREDSLWRALARGLETGLMHMTGEGTESAPPPLHAGAKGRGLRTRCRSFAVEFAAVDVVSPGWWNCDTCGGGGPTRAKMPNRWVADLGPSGSGPRRRRGLPGRGRAPARPATRSDRRPGPAWLAWEGCSWCRLPGKRDVPRGTFTASEAEWVALR